MKKLFCVSVAVLFASLAAAASFAQAQSSTLISPTPLTLTIHLHFGDKYVWKDDWPVAKELTRLTNIKLVNTANAVATKSKEQFNLLLVSRRFPDIVGGDQLKDEFIRYGMEGAFTPLNSLIDEHAPNIRKYLQENPLVAQAVRAPDGNTYHIPYIPDGVVSRGWWIRQDWLDKLNLKAPENVNELYEVLKAFRDRDPNGNGKRDEIPYFNTHENEVYRLVLLWGGRSSGSTTKLDFLVENGKVSHPFAEERFKLGIKNVAKWYAEGLIDKEIFTRKSRAREQLFNANQGGLTHDWFGSTSTYNQPKSVPSRVPGFKLVAIAPPADINGKRYEEDSRKLVMPDGWAISMSSKNKVAAIKLFDFYFSPEGRRLANFGVEGLHYTMENGKPTFKQSILNAGKPVNSQLWDAGAQIPIGFIQDYAYEAQWTAPSGRAGRELYIKEKYNIPQFTGVNMTREERKVYDKYWPGLQTYMEEIAQNWVLGTKDVDKTWDEYQQYLKKHGFNKVNAVMQKAYDRQYTK